MEITVEKARKSRKIPTALIFEVLDGKPLYRKDYQALINAKTLEEIIGSSLW